MDRPSDQDPDRLVRNAVAAELSRRQLMRGAGGLGLAALIAAAAPTLERLTWAEAAVAAGPLDGSLEAFFDTLLPGRVVSRTETGRPITPGAILGEDHEPGAVEADALLLANDGRIGFNALAPTFVADLEARAASHGGSFISLDYASRQAVCIDGLAFSNPDRVIWEAAAAIPFTAFCAAANTVNATRRNSVGFRVMGHPGTAPRGYRNFSYRKRLARGRTRKGNLR